MGDEESHEGNNGDGKLEDGEGGSSNRELARPMGSQVGWGERVGDGNEELDCWCGGEGSKWKAWGEAGRGGLGRENLEGRRGRKSLN